VTRRNAIIAGAALAVLVAAFLGGRYSRTPQVVTKDVVRTQTVEAEKVRTVTVHDVVQAKAAEEKVRTITVTRYRWMPGGITEAETTTRAATDTATHETKQASTKVEKQADASRSDTVVELHTSTAVRPSWSLSLMPGYQWHGTPFIDAKGPLVIGASVEHRFIGPVSLGAWGSTSGAAGATVRMEW
jgi:peroxiredoxin